MSRHMISVLAQTDVASLRTATMHGNEYTIIPCIALVEGVLWPMNAPSPELALASEFARVISAWDGSPLVMNHPVDADGNPVSANSPEVLESYGVGQIFNTRVEDKSLHTELWINNKRVEELGGEVKETVDRMLAEEVIDVSVGIFSQNEHAPGAYNGKSYTDIWRNIVPDHLALLPAGTPGACSVADGCGAPRINASGKENTEEYVPVMKAARMSCGCGGDTKEKCSCNGHQSSAKLNSEGKTEDKSLFKRVASRVKDMFSLKDAERSDGDTRTALSIALEAQLDDWVYIIAVFTESQSAGSVIYEVGASYAMYRRSYTIAEDGTVSFSDTAVEVRPETQFVPVTINAGNSPTKQEAQETVMTKEARVAALIANKATKFTDDDNEFLMGLEESQLEKLEPVVNAAPAEDEPADEPEGGAPAAPATPSTPATEPVTLQGYLDNAPVEVRSALNSAIALQKQHRDNLVSTIKANKRNRFTDLELEKMELGVLESMAAIASPEDFDGQHIGVGSSPRLNASHSDDDQFVAAPSTMSVLGARKEGESADA